MADSTVNKYEDCEIKDDFDYSILIIFRFLDKTYPLELFLFWPLNVISFCVSDKSEPLVTALLRFRVYFLDRSFSPPSKLAVAVVFFVLTWKKYLLNRKIRFSRLEPPRNKFFRWN